MLTISSLFRISLSDSPPLLSPARLLRFAHSRPVLCSPPSNSTRTERKGSRRVSRVQSAYVHFPFPIFSASTSIHAAFPGMLIVGLHRYKRVSPLLPSFILLGILEDHTHSPQIGLLTLAIAIGLGCQESITPLSPWSHFALLLDLSIILTLFRALSLPCCLAPFCFGNQPRAHGPCAL